MCILWSRVNRKLVFCHLFKQCNSCPSLCKHISRYIATLSFLGIAYNSHHPLCCYTWGFNAYSRIHIFEECTLLVLWEGWLQSGTALQKMEINLINALLFRTFASLLTDSHPAETVLYRFTASRLWHESALADESSVRELKGGTSLSRHWRSQSCVLALLAVGTPHRGCFISLGSADVQWLCYIVMYVVLNAYWGFQDTSV